MIINHNMNAMNAHRNMGMNTVNSGKSMEKLSSGLRINRAGDDAAGLAISEKMRGQIRGLDQASRNAQDGISLIQTAEGALNETHSILQRMRELSVQGSNDTNNENDRGQIQKEMDQLRNEIDRISDTTEFNTKKLLNGDSDVKSKLGANLEGKIKVTGSSDKTVAGTDFAITKVDVATAATVDVTLKDSKKNEITINGKTAVLDLTGVTDLTKVKIDDINKALKDAGIDSVTAAYDNTNKITFTTKEAGSDVKLEVTAKEATAAAVTKGTNAKITVDGKEIEGKGNTIEINDEITGAKGLKIDVKTAVTTADADTGKVTIDSVGMNLQIGANEGQNIALSIGNMSSKELGVDSIDVSDAKKSDVAVTTIQSAIDKVSAERSKLGAYQNRLEHTINNLGTSSENLTAAESRVRDVDMAKEMMAFSKNNILSQAAQAMLAQANQQPQGVLQLLR
ncbi:flagellin [Clostridium botulinum]|uniref:flagellin N-terminal helical domain-containing protein n=1 Tax=Clostridium botulinum TaxID=1491 RepID=UPI0013F13539|nr:flagellin [Clostridium botulinum]MBY6838982.1 flagellin [Clostridium botulinum]MBY6917983.1 flagellin [Clostridium botulinum]NFG65064.1 flagellin [Clostridium botulinum]NFH91363.1 flagellin [Clostridium botulinum]NFI19598.1 flagellin [Clostridium botulinum]